MENSILSSIKKMLGIIPEEDAFDESIIIFIDSALMELNTIGGGPLFNVLSVAKKKDLSWEELLAHTSNSCVEDVDKESLFQGIKEFVFIKVKLAFDPPSTSFTIESYKKILEELQWRIQAIAETCHKKDGE